jgi:tetratricopeptide (TPR) repeat protein
MELIMKAMEIDNRIPECYSLLGTLYYHDLKFDKSKEYLEKAILLNPNIVDAHKWLSYIYLLNDDFSEAIRLIDIAVTLDPLVPGHKTDKAVLYFATDIEVAIQKLEALVGDTGNDYANWTLGMTYAINNQLDKAIALFLSRKVNGAKTNWALGYTYGLNGEYDKAKEILNFNLERKKETYVPSYLISVINMGIGDHEAALDWLEKEYEEGPHYIFTLGMKFDPKLTPLEGNPRFEALLAKMPFKRIRI